MTPHLGATDSGSSGVGSDEHGMASCAAVTGGGRS